MDRNPTLEGRKTPKCRSLSARRAWIEISGLRISIPAVVVALRKESVDRNRLVAGSLITLGVALRKESVDRNLVWHCMSEDVSCRSPQGERG